MRRGLVFVAGFLTVTACYDKPETPGQESETLDGTSGDDTLTGSEGGPSTTMSSSASEPTSEPSTTDTPTEGSMSSTDPTEGSSSVDSSSEGGTTAPAACGDGTADSGELCFDGVVPVVVDVDSGAFDIALADFNDDDHLDVVTLATDGTVSVLLADGAGGFASPISIATAEDPCRLRAVDGDGDNDPDLVVGAASLVTLVNDGAAGFDINASVGDDVFFGCGDLTVFNGDGGESDVAYTGAYSFNFAAGIDTPGGWAFGASTDLPAPGEGAWSITAAEFAFDADSNADLLLVNQYYGEVDIVTGNGFGSFDEFGSYVACTGPGSRAAAVEDVDGDGQEDIVTSCMAGNFTLAIGDGAGHFTTSPDFVFAGAATPSFADLDDDGDADLLMPSDTLARINIYLNDGGTLVDDPLQLDVGGNVEFVVTGDLNGDGALDIATAYDDGTGRAAIFYAAP
jgi:hypothetical protein